MTALFTIGHSRHTADALTGLLARHGVEVLADVRSVPHSRFAPQCNKRALEHGLGDIRYVFLGHELGGRPPEPEFYGPDGRVRYDLLSATERFREGIERLTALAEAHPVAVMCAEENPASCHRRLLIGRAAFTLHHIRGDGRVETELPLLSA